jgi:hypothetical protein
VQQWRLSRKGNTVFAMLLIANNSLPVVTPLVLPFVVDVSGGVDGSWPAGTVQTATLLGGGGSGNGNGSSGGGKKGAGGGMGGAVVPHGWNAVDGLELYTPSAGHVSQPYVAVFQLDFA